MAIEGCRHAAVARLLAVATVSAGVVSSGMAHAQAPGGQADAIGRADRVAIFEAAGASRRGTDWVICGEDPSAPQARIEAVRDLNGDGRPEALVMEDGTFCHGHAGIGYALVGRQADGGWKLLDAGSGIPEFLDTRGSDGWPDMSVGGPGFCFPVLRWNGSAYALHRHEYEGKPCQAP